MWAIPIPLNLHRQRLVGVIIPELLVAPISLIYVYEVPVKGIWPPPKKCKMYPAVELDWWLYCCEEYGSDSLVDVTYVALLEKVDLLFSFPFNTRLSSI